MKTALRRIGWVCAALLALLLLYQLWIFTLVLWWSHFNPSSTSFMDIRRDELQEKRPNAELRHEWVPYERISIHLKRAVIAAEDDSFIDHEGFDWEGIQRALEKNQRKGRAVAGGSTISQQLAKNLFLSPTRSYFRKAQEAVITVMIEAVWSKRRILEVYLNVVEWGTGIFGCEAAARRYYGVPASRLGADEAAHLAVMLPNPRKYEKQFGPRLAAHAARIRGRMAYAQVP
ncbi:monofunctional biosynthetic peptidoglycan transglycosylase [Aromatoleum toluvorans]|uniref:Biosynthetic peptidoglycan transglycosylase n=1 Tax=Aromatoleum toluvorans TaxID=92002 RepID=A0ABX1Q4L9_9RHOO|nr:monofunctional biosynthetic peptidoglycan transglycosylase [Aromatoleum toluvorans]NMG45732.1 monofunctional biosynthetic peptidoglycan transglycosylase [Aromatoleum toluvorans]